MVDIPLNVAAPLGRERVYIEDALNGAGVLGGSKYTSLCERWLENALGARRVLLTPSATAALEMSALLLNIEPGDEVIMPSFTFVSTASAFVLRGAVPVFVDIRGDTLNIDETKIAAAITPRTRAIAVVHYAGSACDMPSIQSTARRYGLDVIEDAAHALLSMEGRRCLGTIGRFGALSFHSTKNITCGQGGALLINRTSDIARAEIIREKGTNRSAFLRGDIQKYTWEDLGSSFSISELCSAYLFGQLQEARALTERRLAICRTYRLALAPLEAEGLIRLPPPSHPLSGSNGHIFYVLAADEGVRTRLLDHLRGDGIEAAFHFVPLHTSPAGERYGRTGGSLEVTEEVAKTIIRLPLFGSITHEQVEKVCTSVHNFYAGRREHGFPRDRQARI